MSGRAHRLPRAVWPTHYTIDIATDPAREDFQGKVAIQLDVRAPVDAIELHAKRLELFEVRLEVGGRTLLPQVELRPEVEAVRFGLPEVLAAGPATLTVTYSGEPNPGMHGLYIAQDGGERAVATQCEATDARAIFPCFDEPEFKARLEWRIRTSKDVVALANGPLVAREEAGDEVLWRFAPTEPVSSYLAALTVGRFTGTEETKAGGAVPMRVWAIQGKEGQAAFAHGFTEGLIPWYERYFDVPYPYGKYDQVAVPGFDAGAMENVGLVLFRQNLLLMDPGSASWNQEKLIAKVIAHELAHMWFGNLVTMQWWDDLWLNEAFAEWFAHKATHAAAPSYLVWNDFQSDKNRALVDDALPTTHPIYAPVATPGEALEMFDVITYQKGCAVMRMLEHFLGEEPFRAGLRTYMKAFGGKNATGADLWRHLEEASGQPVGALMRSWVEQAGFPMVSVSLEQGKLRLSQRRFFSSPSATEDTPQVWNVPMVVRYEDEHGVKEHRFILDEAEAEAALPSQGVVRWCYANSDEIGFYRVRHEGEAAAALLSEGAERLTVVEQMGLIEDHWALVRNASLGVQDFLPVLERFAASEDHNVMRAVSDRLSTLDHLLEEAGEEVAREALRAKVAHLYGPHLADLGFAPRDGESQNDRQRRALAIHTVASLAQEPEAIRQCEAWAIREQADPRSVDPNLAGTFVGVAARFGDAARYGVWEETYRARKEAGAAPQDSLRYLYSLAAFRPQALVERTLEHLQDGLVPQEAVGSVLGQMLATLHGQEAAWRYMKANWDALRGRVGDMGLPRVVEATGRLQGRHRADIVEFFAKQPPHGAERALARALENLDQRDELKARLVPALKIMLGA